MGHTNPPITAQMGGHVRDTQSLMLPSTGGFALISGSVPSVVPSASRSLDLRSPLIGSWAWVNTPQRQ